MASGRRKPLYADLFKTPPKPKIQNPASWSSGSLFSCDSSTSSSGFTTPPCSDLASSGSEDDGDFIGDLTRQMAENCMLQEEGDEFQVHNGLMKSKMPSIQVYELKNQPPVKKPGRKRRGKGSESDSAQPPQSQLQRVNGCYPRSGMQAVYLGGSRYGSGSVGTGVFLPRVNRESEPVRLTKKPVTGCSIVLIPTRVLQVLEHHFNRVQDSNFPCPKDEIWSIGDSQEEKISSKNEKGNEEEEEEEMKMMLPKEWTYILD